MEVQFLHFTPNYEKLRSKVAKISKFPKMEKRGSKFYNFEIKSKQNRGLNSTAGWKKGGGSIPRSLPTNSTYAVPPTLEWLNACHIPPRVCLRCISCLEYPLAIYGITYVQPTNSISMVEKISLYFKLELVSFRICHIFVVVSVLVVP